MPPKRWTDSDLQDAELLYRTTDLSVRQISRRTSVPSTTLDRCVKRNGWARPAGGPGPSAAAVAALQNPQRSRARRLDILARALALAERHIAAAEESLAAGEADAAGREREARLIGTIITLVQRHQQAESALEGESPKRGERPNDDPEPDVPRSLDETYREFASHLSTLFGSDPGTVLPAGMAHGGAGGPAGSMDLSGP